MDFAQLKKIHEEHDDVNNRVLSAMDCWLKSDPGACWKKVVNALAAIKKIVLACKLKERYCNPESTPVLLPSCKYITGVQLISAFVFFR